MTRRAGRVDVQRTTDDIHLCAYRYGGGVHGFEGARTHVRVERNMQAVGYTSKFDVH